MNRKERRGNRKLSDDANGKVKNYAKSFRGVAGHWSEKNDSGITLHQT